MRLYVNIDHVATIREARKTDEPDPVQAAAAAERAGADGITVHLREDRRHIQDADVRALARAVRTVLNLELAAAPAIVRIATGIAPHPSASPPSSCTPDGTPTAGAAATPLCASSAPPPRAPGSWGSPSTPATA